MHLLPHSTLHKVHSTTVGLYLKNFFEGGDVDMEEEEEDMEEEDNPVNIMPHPHPVGVPGRLPPHPGGFPGRLPPHPGMFPPGRGGIPFPIQQASILGYTGV